MIKLNRIKIREAIINVKRFIDNLYNVHYIEDVNYHLWYNTYTPEDVMSGIIDILKNEDTFEDKYNKSKLALIQSKLNYIITQYIEDS